MSIPSDRRFRWWDYPVFAVLTLLHLGVLGGVVSRWISGTSWTGANVLFLLLLATVLIEFALWEWRWIALPFMRVPRPRPARPGWRVATAVTFVPASEPVGMLEETVRAMKAIRYPHDTWVLDEGDDPAVHALCERLGVHHFSRRNLPQYQADSGPFKARTKYGNFNAWLEEHGYAAYDMLVAFDSDHIPRPDYLDRVLGWFDDERVAFIQPAQAYYNQPASFIARAAAEETYAYYSSIQMTGYAVGYPIVVGCHNTHRVAALREIGGFPAHEADDIVMTLLYRTRGWRGVYVPRILARGLTPVDWHGYLTQQRRWARSVLDYKLRVFPRHAAGLPFRARVLNYLHGVYYLRGPVTALQIVLLFFVLATGLVPAGRGAWFLRYTALLWATVLLCDYYRQRFFLDRDTEWGLHWRSGFVSFVKWPSFVLAFVDVFRARYGTYTVTTKGRSSERATAFALTHGVVLALLGGAWIGNYVRGPSPFIALHLAAGFAVTASAVAAVTTFRRIPPAWQPELRRRWDEGRLDA